MGLNLMAGSIAMRYCEPLDRCGGLRLAQPISATATSLFLSGAIHGLREVVGIVCALHPVAVAVHIALPARLRKKPCRISKGRPFFVTSSLRNQFVETTWARWGSCPEAAQGSQGAGTTRCVYRWGCDQRGHQQRTCEAGM